MSTVEARRVGLLVRPTLETKFHIDYDWWDRADRDLEVYLRSHLCSDHQHTYADLEADVMVDSVDPETAEVTKVAGVQHILISHCSRQPNYLTPQTSLVNAVFRVFLANSNTPLSPVELSERLGKPPQMILRTFSGSRVYKGIRPYTES
ncbi:MAG: hypothetical protein JSV37_12615 [Anaerolineaceae bacterium]|nr:MAG: hypothetical protein JSV37_12615 [Anaerolineaceae bacterium]